MSTPTIRLPLAEARELAVARMREGKFEAAASLLDRIAGGNRDIALGYCAAARRTRHPPRPAR
jgi:hypothetical protein